MVVDTIISNGRIVTPGGIIQGGVAVEGERIVAVGLEPSLPEARRTIDARGGYVIPGVIDAHVHLGPGAPNRPATAADFRSESRAAAYGGVTTCLVFLFGFESFLPVFDDLIGYGEANSVIDFSYHAGVNNLAQIEDIPRLVERGVTSFKHFFTAYRDESDTVQAMDPGLLYRSFRMIGSVGRGAVAQVHAEDIDVIRVREAELRAQGRHDLEAWSLARSPLSEVLAVDQIALIARETGARGYIVHLSAADGVDTVERAQQMGIDLIAETGPHYLLLSQTMQEQIGCWGKVNSPIRTEADQERLWQGLRDGIVTTMGTDHVPTDLATKENGGGKFGDIWNARPGVPNGMEHLLPLMYTAGVAGGRFDIQQLVRVTSENTAKVFGLYPRKGAILPGSDADLVIVDPNDSAEIRPGFYHGIAREWSPYFGYQLRGRPTLTMVRGTVVVQNHELVEDRPRGRFLARTLA